MNFLQLTPLIAAFANLLLALAVLKRDPRAVVNRVFVGWGVAVAVWNLGAYFLLLKEGPAEAWLWAHVLQAGVIFLPAFNLHLCLLMAQISFRKFVLVVYALHGALLVSLLTGSFIIDIRDVGYSYYSVAGPGFYAFLVVYTLTTAFAMWMLYLKQQTLPAMHRTRLRLMMLAIGILAVFGANDLLPILEIYEYPFTNLPIYPIGNFAAVFYVALVGYSVLQHQLLDLHVAFTRLAAKSVRLLSLLAICFLLLAAVSKRAKFSPSTFAWALGVMAMSSILATFAFPRVLGRGEEALERWLLGDRFGYHDNIVRFTQAMQSSPDPQHVVPNLRRLLVEAVRVKSYEVILLDENTRGFALFHAHPERLMAPLHDLHVESPLFRYFRVTKANYLACRISYAMPGETELEGAARLQLKSFDPEFCFGFFSDSDPVGFLLVGAKASGDPYTPQDLRLLTEMVQSLSLLLNQVRLKNQVLMSQEQELLGRMSRGLAHDLNNLLTPVQTFLQLTAQDLIDEEGRNELLPIASRNIETVRSYVNEALFFSRTHALEVKPLRLDETIRAAVELMQPRAQEKNVEINIQGLGTLVVEMDEIMVQRMLCNLVSNAIDASPPGGPLKIQIVKLPRTETTRDWIRVKIIDAGEGISPENLQRIFTPYFTTKNRGDGKRGFGLGLAISRKIVHLHGGNLSITSLEQKGTTVQIDLPSRHIQNPSRNPQLADATYEATYKR